MSYASCINGWTSISTFESAGWVSHRLAARVRRSGAGLRPQARELCIARWLDRSALRLWNGLRFCRAPPGLMNLLIPSRL